MLAHSLTGCGNRYFQPGHPVHSLRLALYTLAPNFIVAVIVFLILAHVLRRKERINATGGAST